MADRKINERLLKISHRKADWVPILEDLQVDDTIWLKVECQVQEKTEVTTNSEEVDVVYTVKGLWAEKI